MGHQIAGSPLPKNTAGTGFWEGSASGGSRQVGISRSFDYPIPTTIGGIACLEIR